MYAAKWRPFIPGFNVLTSEQLPEPREKLACTTHEYVCVGLHTYVCEDYIGETNFSDWDFAYPKILRGSFELFP